MKKNKLAMVDLDDTLIYTYNANQMAYRKALREQGLDLTPQQYSEICNGRSYRYFLPIIMGEDHPAIETVHRRKIELYPDCMKYAVPNEHLIDILRAISPEYYIALVTTASRINAERILEFFSLTKLFDLTVTREDVEANKPAPDCFLYAMEHYGITSKNCIIFEDSPSGIKAAEASGCRTFCVKWESC